MNFGKFADRFWTVLVNVLYLRKITIWWFPINHLSSTSYTDEWTQANRTDHANRVVYAMRSGSKALSHFWLMFTMSCIHTTGFRLRQQKYNLSSCILTCDLLHKGDFSLWEKSKQKVFKSEADSAYETNLLWRQINKPNELHGEYWTIKVSRG